MDACLYDGVNYTWSIVKYSFVLPYCLPVMKIRASTFAESCQVES